MKEKLPVETIIQYHDRSKHQISGYARGPGYLDWANQPEPFRRFNGAPLINLTPLLKDSSPIFMETHETLKQTCQI